MKLPVGEINDLESWPQNHQKFGDVALRWKTQETSGIENNLHAIFFTKYNEQKSCVRLLFSVLSG